MAKGREGCSRCLASQSAHSSDLLFIDDQPISCTLATGESFQGDAGVIRHCDDGTTQMAILYTARALHKRFGPWKFPKKTKPASAPRIFPARRYLWRISCPARGIKLTLQVRSLPKVRVLPLHRRRKAIRRHFGGKIWYAQSRLDPASLAIHRAFTSPMASQRGGAPRILPEARW